MTIKDLRAKMRVVEKKYKDDPEVMHSKQDDLLLEYIDDYIVKRIFWRTSKWYA